MTWLLKHTSTGQHLGVPFKTKVEAKRAADLLKADKGLDFEVVKQGSFKDIERYISSKSRLLKTPQEGGN